MHGKTSHKHRLMHEGIPGSGVARLVSIRRETYSQGKERDALRVVKSSRPDGAAKILNTSHHHPPDPPPCPPRSRLQTLLHPQLEPHSVFPHHHPQSHHTAPSTRTHHTHSSHTSFFLIHSSPTTPRSLRTASHEIRRLVITLPSTLHPHRPPCPRTALHSTHKTHPSRPRTYLSLSHSTTDSHPLISSRS